MSAVPRIARSLALEATLRPLAVWKMARDACPMGDYTYPCSSRHTVGIPFSRQVNMKVLVQRCREAQVVVAEETVGAIGHGALLLVGIEKGDDDAVIKRMAERVLSYRLFSDVEGKMNLDIRDVQGELLVVSQFTLAADTRKGRRPSFSSAAVPEEGRRLYLQFVDALKEKGLPVATGEFGADMQVHLINDGPVTFMLSV